MPGHAGECRGKQREPASSRLQRACPRRSGRAVNVAANPEPRVCRRQSRA